MKNQYVGDISDFEKYSILRALSAASGLSLNVCWMLTADDSSADGRKLQYLAKPDTYRLRDPVAFDALSVLIAQGARSVGAVESSGLLSNASFHSQILGDSASERAQYFEAFWKQAQPNSLAFFDPDNGIAPRSQRVGRARSSKYVFLDEVLQTYENGHSVVLYQHWPRVKREPFLNQRLSEIAAGTGCTAPFALHGGRVAFIVVPQEPVAADLNSAAAEIASQWQQPRGLTLSRFVSEGGAIGTSNQKLPHSSNPQELSLANTLRTKL